MPSGVQAVTGSVTTIGNRVLVLPVCTTVLTRVATAESSSGVMMRFWTSSGRSSAAPVTVVSAAMGIVPFRRRDRVSRDRSAVIPMPSWAASRRGRTCPLSAAR